MIRLVAAMIRPHWRQWTALRAGAAVMLAAALTGIAAQAAAQRFDQGLLWRVEREGAAASHLFGTIHVDDKRVTDLPPEVARAVDSARSVTVELDLDPSNLFALANRMVLQDGRNLPGIAGAELFRRTAALTAPLGLPEPALRVFRPWAAALLLMTPPQNPESVLDYQLARRAAAQGKPVHQLESVDEQVDVFEGMSEPDQVALLKFAVENYERMPQAVGRLLEAYLARDLGAMARISREVDEDDAEARRLNDLFVQRVLNVRNVRMVERIQPQLIEGGAFVAVGALHLQGERGVLALLERRGWRVTRVY